jgi:hypothetical protein
MDSDSEWNTLLKIIDRFSRYYNHSIASSAFGYYNENEKFCLFKIEYIAQELDIIKYDYGNFKLTDCLRFPD